MLDKTMTPTTTDADALYAKGSHASDVSGLYVRATLFIAASLFFAAISKTFEERSFCFPPWLAARISAGSFVDQRQAGITLSAKSSRCG